MKPSETVSPTGHNRMHSSNVKAENNQNQKLGSKIQNLLGSSAKLETNASQDPQLDVSSTRLRANQTTKVEKPTYSIVHFSAKEVRQLRPQNEACVDFMLGYTTYHGRGLNQFVANPVTFYRNLSATSPFGTLLFPTKSSSHDAVGVPLVTKRTQTLFKTMPVLREIHRSLTDFALANFGLRRDDKDVLVHSSILEKPPAWLKINGSDDRLLLERMVESLYLLDNALLAKNICTVAIKLLKAQGLKTAAKRFIALKNKISASLAQQEQAILAPNVDLKPEELKSDIQPSKTLAYLPSISPIAALETRPAVLAGNPLLQRTSITERVLIQRAKDKGRTEDKAMLPKDGFGNPLQVSAMPISPLAKYSYIAQSKKQIAKGMASSDAKSSDSVELVRQLDQKIDVYHPSECLDENTAFRKNALSIFKKEAIPELSAKEFTAHLYNKSYSAYVPEAIRSVRSPHLDAVKNSDETHDQMLTRLTTDFSKEYIPSKKKQAVESGEFSPSTAKLEQEPLILLQKKRQALRKRHHLDVPKPSSIVAPQGFKSSKEETEIIPKKFGAANKKASTLSSASLNIGVRLSNARLNLADQDIATDNDAILESHLKSNSLDLLPSQRADYVDEIMIARLVHIQALGPEEKQAIESITKIKTQVQTHKKEAEISPTASSVTSNQEKLNEFKAIFVKYNSVAKQTKLDNKVIEINLRRELNKEQQLIVKEEMNKKQQTQKSSKRIVSFCHSALAEMAKALQLDSSEILADIKLATLLELKKYVKDKITEVENIIIELESQFEKNTYEAYIPLFEKEIALRVEELEVRKSQLQLIKDNIDALKQ